MTTLSISPQGKITLPPEILQINTWKGHSQLELFCIGDTVVLRPAHYQKSDNISDLGGCSWIRYAQRTLHGYMAYRVTCSQFGNET